MLSQRPGLEHREDSHLPQMTIFKKRPVRSDCSKLSILTNPRDFCIAAIVISAIIILSSAIELSLLPSRPRQMRLIKSGPLTNREIDKLDAFLLSDGGLERAMNEHPLSMASSARCSRGRMSSCPRNGCGGSGIWRKANRLRVQLSEKQGERILDLLMRHANDIAVTLTQAPRTMSRFSSNVT